MLNRAVHLGAVFAMLLASTAASAQSAIVPLPVHRRQTPISPALPVIGPNNRDWMAAHFINVGQGASTLLEFSCGLVLIDTGGGEAATGDWRGHFVSYLEQVFARRPDLHRTIDLLVLTHPHKDHTFGAPRLANASYAIRQIITNAQLAGSGIRQQRGLTQYAGLHHIPVRTMQISSLTGVDGLTDESIDPLHCNGTDPDIRLLWGSSDRPARWTALREGNNHSVVVRVAFEESSFLIIGDLEEAAQRAMLQFYARNPSIFDVDVYEAGHHGSRNGTTPELVDKMMPEIAVIEAGNPGRREAGFSAYTFGHPNIRTIDLLTTRPSSVSRSRPPVTVTVGVSGQVPHGGAAPVFRDIALDRAIFSTGWDGDVVIYASRTGEKRAVID